MIPWVEGARTKGGQAMHSGYTAERVKWIAEQLIRAAPTLPVYVATPHADADLGKARKIDVSKFLANHRLTECGVMTAAFHPQLDGFDIDLVTADTLVLRDPREVMPRGHWWAPQQHLPDIRPYGDWFMHIPAGHPIRQVAFAKFTGNPSLTVKFDRYMIEAARSANLCPRLVTPPLVINGEWVMRDWKPWAQPVVSSTAALHPTAGKKFPELLDDHPWFSVAKDRTLEPIPTPSWPDLPEVPWSLQ